jgi:hypothetical protein
VDGHAVRQAVVSDLVDLSIDSAARASRKAARAACAVALVAGLALAGCGTSKPTPPTGSSASVGATGTGSPGPGGQSGGSGTGTGSGSGGTSGGGTSGGGTGGGGGGAPKPGAPPECTDIANAAALHEIGDTLDKMDTPDTSAAAKATLHADAGQLTTIAAKTSDGTLRSRLNAFAVALNSVADSGTDNMGTMMSFATTLRDVSQSAQEVCGLSIG